MPRKPLDHIEPGMKIDKLTVLSPASPGAQGSSMWSCICDCGREIVGAESALKTYRLHTCGCSDGKEDLTGNRYGKLVVISRSINSAFGRQQYLCCCDCGNEKVVLADYLKKFHEPNCGCLTHDQISAARSTHGLESHHLYPVWKEMISRCEKPNHKNYDHYGARGITVCERWHDVRNFVEDMEPTYQPGLELDRVDNDSGYSPENCRWVTRTENVRNRENTVKVDSLLGNIPAAELAEKTDMPYGTVMSRRRHGYPDILITAKGEKKLSEVKGVFEGDSAVWLNDRIEGKLNRAIDDIEKQVKELRENE